MKKEQKTYEEIIREAANEQRNENIPNSSLVHAEVGIRELLARAYPNTTVRIVSYEFFEEFWAKFINALSNFLSNNGIVEILLLSKKNRLIEELQKQFGGDKVKVYLANEDIKKKEKEVPHFVVLEPKGYRFELSDKDLKDKIVRGYVNFGDENGSKELRKFFDTLKEKTTLI